MTALFLSFEQTNYWVWRIDPSYRQEQRERVSGSYIDSSHLVVFSWCTVAISQVFSSSQGCFSPLWVAFSILIGGLMLDVLISITLGVSALPVNIIIGMFVFQCS